MYFRPATFILFAVLLFISGSGCQKPEAVAPVLPPTVLSPDTIASVHWLGKRQLGYEATAFFFMRIWNLAQTAKLERQTFDRLTTVPERFFPGGTNLTSASSTLMLPLIYDLEQEESYVEIRAATNSLTHRNEAGTSQPAVVLAIRLNDPAQAGRWFTNLAAVLEPMTGSHIIADPTRRGWTLKTINTLNLIQLARVGNWTLVGIANDKNPLLDEITIRIKRDGVPFVSAGTNLWLEADLNLQRIAQAFPSFTRRSQTFFSTFNLQPSTFNRFSLKLTGDGANVITRAALTFTKPLTLELEPWKIPLRLIHEPLTSFTAARGLEPLLADWKIWSNLQIAAPPNQCFFWTLSGSPYQTYFAAPLPDAAQQVAALSNHLLQKGNPWLAAHGYISFDSAPDGNGVTWGNLPQIKPFIKTAGNNSTGWLYAGLLPDTNNAAAPPPTGMIQDILSRTNLVYYDWEVTGPRLNPDRELAQTIRLVARRPHMDLDSASMDWLAMLIPRLGTSATIINLIAPNQFTLYRRSTFGLTAPELHLLADWLESPRFPSGLHSTTIP